MASPRRRTAWSPRIDGSLGPPIWVITDVFMPDGDGIEMLTADPEPLARFAGHCDFGRQPDPQARLSAGGK